ncbi:MAG: VWA domain-containing protein [Chloroflexi bacterium]|nr:VWA domain-containing protein [Chloroflexota bacterium]
MGRIFRPRRLQTPQDRTLRRAHGKRSRTKSERKRGHYIRSRPAEGRVNDLAFDATLRQAAPYQIHRDRSDVALAVETSDLREKVRVRRSANLILFLVDASWSMAAAQRMEAAKGAIMSLLIDAYQKRDRVSLITFQRHDANLVLPPTNSVELANRAMIELPVGGRTPLSRGLFLAYEVLTRERRQNPDVLPLLVLLTDGAGNVSMTDLPPQEEALRVAGLIKAANVRSIVINTEHSSLDVGLARGIADRLGGQCYAVADLEAEHLYQTVRDEIR